MNRRRALLRTGLALGASLIVSPARACEYFADTMRITHPWTRATGGADSCVVCMKFDDVRESDRLIDVQAPVAERAELVGDFAIPKGGELVLSEDGAHVRLVGLKQPLFIGRTYPLKLVFEKSAAINANLNVDFLRLSR